MLILLSPSKTMDLSQSAIPSVFSQPELLDRAEQLVHLMKKKSARQLATLLKINPQLAQLNFERYQQWSLPFTHRHAGQAVYTFKGEVFNGLDMDSLTEDDALYAQDHLRIFSGLYGILKPLDLILPYRLDIADPITVNGKNLYQFWKKAISENLEHQLSQSKTPTLINLASNEYFKSVDLKKIRAQVITPVFKESKGNSYKIVTMYAKKARGMMTRFILQNRLQSPDEIKLFDKEGYYFNEKLSSEQEVVFTR
ncbi:MAG: peroxide stress protein YaaA [Bacteroidales bacterium]|nr:peroxide stress protein YaaA [Bacteroidales bacterium]